MSRKRRPFQPGYRKIFINNSRGGLHKCCTNCKKSRITRNGWSARIQLWCYDLWRSYDLKHGSPYYVGKYYICDDYDYDIFKPKSPVYPLLLPGEDIPKCYT